MLHQMAQGPVNCRRLARRSSIAGLMLLAAVTSSNDSFAAANEDKKPPANRPAAETADSKAVKRGGDLGDGRLIRVRLPLAGNDDAHIKSAIQRAIAQLARAPHRDNRPTLILELV